MNRAGAAIRRYDSHRLGLVVEVEADSEIDSEHEIASKWVRPASLYCPVASPYPSFPYPTSFFLAGNSVRIPKMNQSPPSRILIALLVLAIFSFATACSDSDDTGQPNDAGHSGDVADGDAGQNDADTDVEQDVDTDTGPSDVAPPAEEPELFISPTQLTLHAPSGGTDRRVVTLQNIGSAPLEIDDIYVADGDDTFSISFFDELDQHGDPPSHVDDADEPPSVLDPDDSTYMRVHFSPVSTSSATGLVHVHTNDPFVETATIELVGNTEPPCLDVISNDEFDFGPAALGESTTRIVALRNCSPLVDLTIFDATLDDDPDGVFAISDSDFPDALADLPKDIAPLDVELLYLSFSPDGETEHTGTLTIESTDAVSSSYDIALSGSGFDAGCPTAEVAGSIGGGPAQNPLTADAMDFVQLTSDGSQAADGGALDYQWTIYKYPDGSLAQIDDPTAENPTTTLDVAGRYLIELRVIDPNGLSNCEPALLEINVE